MVTAGGLFDSADNVEDNGDVTAETAFRYHC